MSGPPPNARLQSPAAVNVPDSLRNWGLNSIRNPQYEIAARPRPLLLNDLCSVEKSE
jgi:hypothetical protein